MTVIELIQFLSTQPENALVVISAIEGGVNECQTAIGVKVKLDSNKDWHPGVGDYDIIFHDTKHLIDNELRGVLIQ